MRFEVAADAYDSFMGRWSRPLAPQMAELAGIRPGHRVLDVGCGTGVLTAELVARLGPKAVTAVDPSESFVAAVQGRLAGVEVLRSSADAMPFEDGSFDAALAQLVVHFMPDPVAGLVEMSRVTRPGGSVAACVWDYGGGRGPLGAFWVAARELDPDVDDESELPGTNEGHLIELFEAAGLRTLEARTLEAQRGYSGFEDWWEPFTRGVGPAGAYLASLDPGQRAALAKRCRAMVADGPFVLTASAWAARGEVG